MLLGGHKNHSVEQRYFRFGRSRHAVGMLTVHADGCQRHLHIHRPQPVQDVVQRFGFSRVLFEPYDGNAAVEQYVIDKGHFNVRSV